MLDMALLAEEIAAIVADEVERSTSALADENKALRARIDALEGRDVVALATPQLQELVSAEVKSVIAALPAPQHETSLTTAGVASLIADQVKEAVAAIPAPKDGTSVTLEDVAPLIAEQVKVAVAALPAPKDGRDGADGESVDPDSIKTMVAEAVAALPAPKDGRDGTDVDMDAVQRMIGDAVAALPVAKDGVDGAGIADLLIDRSGSLIATFTDGRMKDLGHILGKDGRDGTDGADGIPFGIDDIDMTLMEDGRTVRMAFTKGDTEYAFQIPFPVILDRGVFTDGKAYEEGDGVTWGGSFWIAQRNTSAKPDGPDSGWRLAVKRGRDGKDKV